MPQLTMMKYASEKELIESCVSGNSAAQKDLYEKYSPKMLGICMRYANDYHGAEDILQEGFVKAFRNLSKFRHEGSFEGWLRRIMVNTAIEIHRRKKNMYPILEVENLEVEFHTEDAVSMLAAEDIMSMVVKLSPGYRTVFNLYAIEGYSHKEIAEQLNISEGTSKSQLARARYILMRMVEERTGYKQKAIG